MVLFDRGPPAPLPPIPLPLIGSLGCHSAMVPSMGGGEDSLNEQKEAGLEHRETESSGQGAEPGASPRPGPGGGAGERGGLRPHPPPLPPPLTNPRLGLEAVAVELVTIELVAMGMRPGRLRKREWWREWEAEESM